MKKFSVMIVLLWAVNAHAGLFSHVIKPAAKAVKGASVATAKAVAGKSADAAQASKKGAQASKNAVKRALA